MCEILHVSIPIVDRLLNIWRFHWHRSHTTARMLKVIFGSMIFITMSMILVGWTTGTKMKRSWSSSMICSTSLIRQKTMMELCSVPGFLLTSSMDWLLMLRRCVTMMCELNVIMDIFLYNQVSCSELWLRSWETSWRIKGHMKTFSTCLPLWSCCVSTMITLLRSTSLILDRGSMR